MAPDGKMLYAISSPEGRSLALIGVDDLLIKRTIRLPLPPRTAFLSRDGKRIYIASLENGVMLARTGLNGGVEKVISTSGPVYDVAATPDDQRLFLAMGYRGLMRIDLPSGESRLLSPQACPVSLNVSPSGQRLYVSYQCGGPGGSPGHDVVDIYDVDSERGVEAIKNLAMVGGHPIFPPEEDDVVLLDGMDACSSPRYDHVGCLAIPSHPIYLWRPSDHRVVANVSLPSMANVGTFFPKGTRLFFSGSKMVIWDWARQTCLETMSLPGVGFGLVALTPTGNRAFVSMGDATGLLVFDAEKEDRLPPMSGLTNFYTGDGTQDDSESSGSLRFAGKVGFVPGLNGQAFRLEGAESFLSAEEGVAFCPFCLRSWSASLFVKFNSTIGEMTILEREDTDASRDLRLFKSNDNRIVLKGRGPAENLSIVSSARVDAGRWYHLAVLTGQEHRSLFIDGALLGVQPLAREMEAPAAGVNRHTLFFGATQGKRYFLNGLIDEITIYRRALTPGEVVNISGARGGSK